MPSDKTRLGPHLHLTPGASGLLELLQDLGHIDEVSFQTLTDSLMERPDTFGVATPPGDIDPQALRRAAAAVLLEQMAGARGATRDRMLKIEQSQLLEKEWRLLFS